MKLSLIAESFDKLVRIIADRDGIAPEDLISYVKSADPTGKQYGFVLKLVKNNKIRLPEDAHKTAETIANFEKYKPKLQIRDINRYDSLQQLQVAVEPYVGSVSKSQGDIGINWKDLPGITVVARDGKATTIAVEDPNTLAELGEGTQWCTRKSYPHCMAAEYIKDYGHINIVMVGNVPTLQYTPDYDQVMNRDDEDIRELETDDPIRDGSDATIADHKLLSLIPLDSHLEPINVMAEHLPTYYAKQAFDYMRAVGQYLDGRDPKVVKALSWLQQSPRWAFHYARDILGDRWPAAEPVIAKNAYFACSYLMEVMFKNNGGGIWGTVIKRLPPKDRRWVEAEPAIYGSIYEEAYDEFVRDGVSFAPSSIQQRSSQASALRVG